MHVTFMEGIWYWSEAYEQWFQCVGRWFVGTVEFVALRSFEIESPVFVRTARAMAPMFDVRESLGGVTCSYTCHHRIINTTTYGQVCELCGSAIRESY